MYGLQDEIVSQDEINVLLNKIIRLEKRLTLAYLRLEKHHIPIPEYGKHWWLKNKNNTDTILNKNELKVYYDPE